MVPNIRFGLSKNRHSMLHSFVYIFVESENKTKFTKSIFGGLARDVVLSKELLTHIYYVSTCKGVKIWKKWLIE